MSLQIVDAGELMVRRNGSIDPAKFPDEQFELHSIPAFDAGRPEFVPGRQIGSTKQVVQPNDVMISKIVPHIRRASVVGPATARRQIASGEWIVFRSELFFPNYLRHLLISDEFNAKFMATVSGVGGSLLRARPAEVAKIRVPLPPLTEQRRIAAILDKADALRAKRREAIAKLDQLLQSVYLDMFGGPVDMRRWDRVPLGEIASTSSGGTPDRSVAGYYGGGIPWVKSGEVVAGEVAATEESITPLGLANSSAKLVSAGTVLLAMYGATAGAVAMLKIEAATNQAICAIKPGERMHPLFLLHFLKNIAPSLVAKAVGGAQPNLSQGLIRALMVPVPPMELQEKFADVVTGVARHRSRLVETVRSTEALFSSLQSRAFSRGL